ncbi:MAG: fibronectin type III domain-containing protein [Patescibacteria group bacterium]
MSKLKKIKNNKKLAKNRGIYNRQFHIERPRPTRLGVFFEKLRQKLRLYKPVIVVLLVLFFGALSSFLYDKFALADSDHLTLTSETDWQAGEYYPNQLSMPVVDQGTGDASLQMAAGGVGSFDPATIAFPEQTRGRFDLAQEPTDYGADLTTDGTYLYMIIGGKQPDFFRYNPETNTWKTLADAPTSFDYGSAITYYDGFIYAIVSHHDGTYSTDDSAHLLKYDILNDTWSWLEDALGPWGRGADIEAASNGKLYAVEGEGEMAFWVFDTATGHWSNTIQQSPDLMPTYSVHSLVFSDVSVGADPVYCEGGCIYALVANSRQFNRYDIGRNEWTTGFNDVPAAIGNFTTGGAVGFDSTNDDIYIFRGGSITGGVDGVFVRYDIGSPGTWDVAQTTTQNPRRTTNYGASLVYLDGYIYSTWGGALPGIGRFTVGNGTNGSWDSIDSQIAMGTNADGLIVYVDGGTADCADASGCLFVAQGGGTAFRRYDISTRAWTAASGAGSLTTITAALGQGASMCYDGSNNIYIARGGAQNQVYEYSISGNAHTTLSIPAAAVADEGASITCFGNGNFYLLSGNNSQNIYHYCDDGADPADPACDGWQTNETIPSLAVFWGGALANDGTYVYALAGNQRGNFHRYEPGADTWASYPTIPDMPTASYYTTTMEFDGDDALYVIPGQYDKTMWRYDITGQAWSRAVDLPHRFGYSHGLALDNDNDLIYVLSGGAPNTSSTTIYKFNTESHDYIPTATWISEPLDLDFVSAWETFSATHPTDGTSSISFDIRSSDDGVSWTDWENIVNASQAESTNSLNISAISTPENRYAQIRVTLTSDNTNTPALEDISLYYTKDSTDPANPAAAGYDTSDKVTTLASGTTYFYSNPYFELSGATDTGGSGVVGYYVALVTAADSAFDPSTSEDYYQTGATYQTTADRNGNSIVDGTYYLKVATKDRAGNISSAQSLFTYVYNGIDAAATKVWTDKASFEESLYSETNINTEAGGETSMTLDAISNGAWTSEAPAPVTIGAGSSIIYGGTNTLYTLRAANPGTLYKYNTATKIYTTLTGYGSQVSAGSSMVYVPVGVTDGCTDILGCIFATRGGSQTTFQRFDPSTGATGTWSALTALTLGSGAGSSLAYDNNDTIYYHAGYVSPYNKFYKYTISTGEWSALSDTPQLVTTGGTMSFVPQGDYCAADGGCIYMTRGNTDVELMQYTASGGWVYKANAPATFGDGASTRYGNDGYIYLLRGNYANDFYRYDVLNDQWESMPDTPTMIYQGSEQGLGFDPVNRILYAYRGYSEYSLFAYYLERGDWRRTRSIPNYYSSNGFEYGSVAYDGDADILYVIRGQQQTSGITGGPVDFWAYELSTNTWTKKANVPHAVWGGGDLVYVNHSDAAYDGLYYLVGNESLADQVGYFYRYNILSDTWIRLPNTPAEPGQGATMVWDGTNTLYASQGGSTTYWKYTIDDGAGEGTWAAVAETVPAAPGDGACAVKVSVGDPAVDYIYLVQSGNTQQIFRFRISTEDWQDVLPDHTEGNLRYARACAPDGQGNILIPKGNSTTSMYVFNTNTSTWGTTRSTLSYYSEGDMAKTDENVILGFSGLDTSAMDRYVVAVSGETGFAQTGTWTSGITDFGAGLYGYDGLKVNVTDATNTTVDIETRTCSDDGCSDDLNDAHWEAWTEVADARQYGSTDYYHIASTPARYAQVRISITSDQLYTPTINDITWNYYTDGTAPSNPASVDGYTDSGMGTGINDDTWTNDATPYFNWTASDNAGGIGIDGFYVYFGNDGTKDPVDDAADPTNLAYASGTNYYSAVSGTNGSWNATTQSAAALTSDEYYLKIRTKDRNDNIAVSSDTLFTFKLDILAPTRPASSGFTVTPSSWTSNNSFSFTWAAAADTGGSGIQEYCYYVNDVLIDCTSELTVSGITAPQTRENTFCVYTKDNAENTSSSCREKSFYYAGDAPSAPGVITVDPVTSELDPLEDVNQFSFNWDLPSTCLGSAAGECSADDIDRYCYTFNDDLPSAGNCGTNINGTATPSPDGGWTTDTQTSQRSLLSFSAASQQGLNTIHIVAADLIGNIDYDNYTSASFYFTSNAPGVPTSATATDTSDRATQKYSVVLTWDEPEDLGSGVDGYKIYRCEADCESPSAVDDPPANYTNIATVNTLGYLDTSLDNTITYSYFIRSAGTGNTQSGNSSVLQIKPEGKFKFAPLMSGQPTVTPYIRSAIIEWLTLDDQDQYGNIVSHPASSYIEYGETTGYGSEAGSPEMASEHSVTLTNLQPDTTYHYRARWEDQDSNKEYSSDFTFATKGAPSAPINLAVDPETNTENSYTFAWEAPQDEGVTVAGYYYTINNLPNTNNVTYTEETSVGPIDAATQQGKNTFYVLAVDDGGNLSYENYAAIEFEANTSPPGSPQAVTITDSSDRDAKRYSITITWDPPEGYTIDDEIYYTISRRVAEAGAASAASLHSATEGEDAEGFEEIATITSTGYLDTGLDSSTEYFYKITARDKAQATSDSTDIISEVPEGRFTQPPAITEAPVVAPDSYSAKVTWRTERIASSFVDFGTSASDLSEEQGTADLKEQHEVEVTGLKAETTYYYRVKSIDVDENEAHSEVGSFKTLEAPRVMDLKISDIRLYDAMISWDTNKETTAIIQYGTSANYGLTYTDVSGSYALTHTVKLESLKDEATYHLRIAGQDRSGNMVTSDDYVFTTLTFPEVTDVSYQNKSEGQSEIFWKTNVPTTSEVEYYSENIAPKTQGNTAMVKEHSILLYGLEDATRYLFKVRGSDEFGYEALSEENEFTTLEDTTPPEVYGVQSESNTIGSGESSKIQIVVSWKTNEPTTSQVDYGVGMGSTDFTDQTEENAELVMDHLVIIPDLVPAKTYHFRVVSRDKAGNLTKSGSHTVLTSRKRESFLQLIITNLETTFSWLGNIGNAF